MRHGKGTDLPGMTDPEAAKVGVIYVSPDDIRKVVVTAILAEERLKRDQIVLVLPPQNKAFQRPEDFDDLKMLRRKIQAGLIFITPAGPGPAEFARQRRFPVFSTEESFVRSFMTGTPNPPVGPPTTANSKPAKKGLFGLFGGSAGSGSSGNSGDPKKPTSNPPTVPIIAAGAAASSASNDISALSTQPVAQRPSRSLRPGQPARQPVQSTQSVSPQTPQPQAENAFRSSAIDADATEDQPDNRRGSGLRNAGLAGAAGLGAGIFAADQAHHTPSTGHGPNIDDDDDWDALPPASSTSGQSLSEKLPNTPAATQAGVQRASVPLVPAPASASRTPNTAVEPNPIELPVSRSAPKITKKFPAPVETTPPAATNAPRRNAGVAAALVGVGAGAMLAGASTHGGNASAGTSPTRAGAAGGTRPPMRNLSSIGPGGPGMGGPMNPRGQRPKRDRRAVYLIALILLLLLLLVSWAVSAHPDMIANVSHNLSGSSTSPVTVTITPASKTVQDTYLMQGVSTGTADPNNRQISVRTLNSSKSITKQVTATGHTQIPATVATGTLTFLNGSATTETIAPTTLANANGVQVIANGNVTIQGLNPNTGQAGVASVLAHAVSPGAAGNIAAQTLNGTCCLAGGFIIVKNMTAFTGGQNAQNYNFLQTSDVNSVTTANQDTLKVDAQKDIQGQVKSGEKPLGDVICNDPKTTEDQLPGARGVNVTSANVTVTISCSGQVYDANAVQTIAQNALQQKASKDPGPGYVLAGSIVTQAQPPVVQQGGVTFSVSAQGVWYYPWTNAMKQALLNKIKGKTITQAQAILNTYPGVGSAKIASSNGNNTLPSDPNQITLNIPTVNGLSAGNQQTGPNGSGGGNSPQPSITPIGGKGVIPANTDKSLSPVKG